MDKHHHDVKVVNVAKTWVYCAGESRTTSTLFSPVLDMLERHMFFAVYFKKGRSEKGIVMLNTHRKRICISKLRTANEVCFGQLHCRTRLLVRKQPRSTSF